MSILSGLFSTGIRRRLLTHLLLHTDQEFHLRGIARQLGISASSTQGILRLLEETGLVSVNRQAGAKFYRANPLHPLFQDIRSILLKTEGLAEVVLGQLADVPSIRAACIYGSIAEEREVAASDVDVLVIGEPDLDRLHEVGRTAEQDLGRHVSFAVFSVEEWQEMVRKERGFARKVLAGRRIPLVGDIDDI